MLLYHASEVEFLDRSLTNEVDGVVQICHFKRGQITLETQFPFYVFSAAYNSVRNSLALEHFSVYSCRFLTRVVCVLDILER